MLSQGTYQYIKTLVQIVLPATGTLYFSLAGIWGLPHAEAVVGTLVCFTTFLGVILGVSSYQYEHSGAGYDGTMVVTEKDENTKTMTLELDGDPADMEQKRSIRFRVDKEHLGPVG